MARKPPVLADAGSLGDLPPITLSHNAPARGLFLASAAIVVVATLLRLAGLGKDLWLDEIWSLRVATDLRSPLDVFTLHHEINHHLNTLWLYLVGPYAGAVRYHLLSFVAGIGSVILAGFIGFRRGASTALILLTVFGLSYELVLFSSEARGYSLVAFASLASFYFLDAYLARPLRRTAAVYAACTILGFLAQPIFVNFFAAACVWSALRFYRSSKLWPGTLRMFVGVQGIPLVFFAVLYFVDLRLVVPGGGTPANSLIDAYGVGLAWALGTPQTAVAELGVAVLAVVFLESNIRWIGRAEFGSGVFFAGAIVLFPILLIVVRGSNLVYTRHFLVGTVFFLLLIGWRLGSWWDAGKRWPCIGFLVAYAATNAWHIADLAMHGRGQHGNAVRFIVDNTATSSVSIGGDQDFRIGTELAYYLPREAGNKSAKYFEQGSWPQEGPQWIITQRESFDPVGQVPDQLTDAAGHQYELAKVFPTAPLSGLHWFLYRNRVLR